MMTSVHSKARRKAYDNGRRYHLAAILRRKGKPIRIGVNGSKTHPKFKRQYDDGTFAAHMHAEMDALRFAKPGDELEVLRWRQTDDSLAMAKPCRHCMEHIIRAGISRVLYTTHEGTWEEIIL